MRICKETHEVVHTSLVIPAGGDFASKSVEILKPSLQQFLVNGPLVQAESGTLVVVACLWTKAGASLCGIAPAEQTETRASKLAALKKSILKGECW
jgi:hypothetical protein